MSNPVSNVLSLNFSMIPVGTDVDTLLKTYQEYEYFPMNLGAYVKDTRFNSKSPEFKWLCQISEMAQKLDMPMIGCYVLADGDYGRNIQHGNNPDGGRILREIPLLHTVSLFPSDPKFQPAIYNFAQQNREKYDIDTMLISNRDTAENVKKIANTKRAPQICAQEKPFPYIIEHVGDLMDSDGLVENYYRTYPNAHFKAMFAGGVNCTNIRKILTNIVNGSPMHKQTRVGIGSAILNNGKINWGEYRAILSEVYEWLTFSYDTQYAVQAGSTMNDTVTRPDQFFADYAEFCELHARSDMKYHKPAFPYNLDRNTKVEKITQQIWQNYAARHK